ncbi:MAG: HAD-IG family 5'-nucleotidase [Myxococcales bacterium]|nr:HAD-IG family 5'-nucleotidase [Myxococcales bacterium]
MSQIDWVGFDMDYTLALYRQSEMDRLSIAATVPKLVARGYPALLGDIPYAVDFPIRGLLIDKRLGNVLKMNRFKVVRKGYHGLRELAKEELVALYHERRVRPRSERYHWIDTLYALSEVAMFVSIIEALEARGEPCAYERLFTDIRECIDEAHRDGTILDQVVARPERYIERDPALGPALHKLRSAGKRIFLLTNSRWAYTRKILSYLFDGTLPDYPGFQGLFDAVIVAAKKPSFFQQGTPLAERRGDKLVPARLPLERGRVYEGGSLQELQQALGVTENRVLYVGDHIYGDMLRSKKESTWRTAMIIQELETEIAAHVTARPDLTRSLLLGDRRAELEDVIRHHGQRLRELARLLQRSGDGGNGHGPADGNGGGHADGEGEAAPSPLVAESIRLKRLVHRGRAELHALERQHAELKRGIDSRFHPYWGSLLKQGNELSLFGDQVSEYACLYTSRVSNLCAYSPLQYFRGPRGVMHHEL